MILKVYHIYFCQNLLVIDVHMVKTRHFTSLLYPLPKSFLASAVKLSFEKNTNELKGAKGLMLQKNKETKQNKKLKTFLLSL